MPNTRKNINGESEVWYSCAETAALVRQALKEAFPRVKFSVRSKTYSGGASMHVSWIDGPTVEAVEAITGEFEGADFDGMQDLKTYRKSYVNGQRVHYGADYIFTDREFSAGAKALVEARARQTNAPETVEHDYWRCFCEAARQFDFSPVLFGKKPLLRPAARYA